MIHASLFSGIGGFDLAAEKLGWENKFNCENDEFCRKILKYHFPDTISYGDIKKTDFTQYKNQIDVLTGGFPCQPFSIAGKQGGKEDNRYLWPEMLRAIKEIRPTWIVGENVANITNVVQPGKITNMESERSLFDENCHIETREHEYVIETICKDLEEIGYTVQPIAIPACSIGAPHQRQRIWFLAHTAGNRWYSRISNISESIVPQNQERIFEEIYKKWEERESWSGEIDRLIADSESEQMHGSGSQQSLFSNEEQTQSGGRDCQDDDRNASNTNQIGLQRSKQANSEEGQECINQQSEGCDRERICTASSNTNGSGGIQDRGCGEPELYDKDCPQAYWSDFPVESPVCCRDDGVSFGLDDITFPKWRRESIKAYGNAIVPQVAMVIFGIIDDITKKLP